MPNDLCKNGCIPYIAVDNRVLQPGTVLNGRYLVGRVLGQGGFGITYIGRDLVLDICVAIKEYFPTQIVIRDTSVSLEIRAASQKMSNALIQGNEKFLEEAQILARFRGEKGIVDVLDFFQQNNTAYIVMEYIDGQTLQSHLNKAGKLPPDQVFSLMAPVMASLDRLHQAGLIHRDISPDNIMITYDGQVKLLDFGTVRNANLDGNGTLTVMVRHGYAPEEQYDGNSPQGPWTDIYALCATMYKCITGITPEESRQRRNQDTVQPPSQLGIDISSSQEAALMKGMARDYRKRFQSVGTLAAALYPDRQILRGNPRPGRIWKMLAISGGALTALLGLVVLLWFINRPSPGPNETLTSPPLPPDNSNSQTAPSTTITFQPVISWQDNVLMSDVIDASSVASEDYHTCSVFGSDYTRDRIGTVTFVDTLDGRPIDAWDISESQDGSVMAWVKQNSSLLDLYIGAEGGLSAPEDCSYLFAGYENVESIQFGSKFDTSKVTNMYCMFCMCGNLGTLDVSGFDTSKVTDMGFMFYECSSLGALDVSGFDTSKVTTMRSMFNNCSSLTALDVSGFDTARVESMRAMFSSCSALEALDVSGFDTSKVESMRTMFWQCSEVETLDVSGFDTTNVTDMYDMFAKCGNLRELDVSGFDTAKVTNMRAMFWQCGSLKELDVSGFDTAKVTTMRSMFAECSNLRELDVSGFDTANVTDLYAMFYGCGSLKALEVSGFNTAKVTDMHAVFYECSSLKELDVSGFDTANVTDMGSMFYKCNSLKTLDVSGFDTANVTDMRSVFNGCSSVGALDVSGFDTAKVTTMRSMFNNCSSLKELDVSGFDTANVTSMYAMFYNCSGIDTLDLNSFDTAKVTEMNYMFAECGKLTRLRVSNWNTSNVDTSNMFNNCSLDSQIVSAILSGETVSV